MDRTRPRPGIGLALAILSWIATLVAAIGPAHSTATVVEWPADQTLLGPEPVGTPMLLAERFPRSLDLAIACATLRAQPGGTVVLATTRTPRRTEALLLTVAPNGLELSMGDDPAVLLPLPRTTDCRAELRLRDDQATWRLDGRTQSQAIVGSPVVSGLFSDLSHEPSLAVRLESRSQDSSPSGRQVVAILLALVSGTAALWGLRQRRAPSRRFTVLRPTAPDVAVTLALLGWWIAGPTLSDDGWWQTLVRNQRSSGTFSYYYDQLNAQEIFGFAHHVVLAAVTRISSDLLWLRLPATAFGIATWLVCRRMLARRRPDPMRAVWVAAAVFLVGWIASDMTLRPEPMVAFLAVTAASGMQRFREDPSGPHLIGPALAVAVAVTIHPVGLVALAPVFASLRSVTKYVRGHRPRGLVELTTIALVALTVGVLLLTADTDLQRWSSTRSHVSEAIGFGGVLGEWERYRLLFTTAWGPPIRRAAFLIPVVALTVATVRQLAERTGRLRLDADMTTFVIALALLSPSPTKWPNHLGSLAGLAALAVASQVGARHRWSTIGGSVVLVVLLTLWPGRVSEVWGPWMPLSPRLSDWLWMLFPPLVFAAGLTWWRRASTRDATELLGVVAGTAVVVALAVFAIDGLTSSPSWSIARQNLGVSHGRCGLAGSVTTTTTNDRDAPLSALVAADDTATLHDISLGPLFPCAAPPIISAGIAHVPDLVVRSRKGNEGAIVKRLRDPFVMLFDIHDVAPIELSDPEHRFAPDLRVSQVETSRLRTFDPGR